MLPLIPLSFEPWTILVTVVDPTLIIVPAFNEESSIGSVLKDLKKFTSLQSRFEICVINDGSRDSTSEIARSFGVHVLDLPLNIGVGGALRTGYRFAMENGFQRVIHFDADGQHQSESIVDIMEALDKSDFVIGSRYGKNMEYPISFVVRSAQVVLSVLLRIFHGANLTDPTSGFRGTKGDLIKIFARKYPSPFLADTIGSIILAKKHKFQVEEIFTPMKVRQSGDASQNFYQRVKYFILAMLLIMLWREIDS